MNIYTLDQDFDFFTLQIKHTPSSQLLQHGQNLEKVAPHLLILEFFTLFTTSLKPPI